MAVVTRDARRGIARLPWSLALVPLAVIAIALAIAFGADKLYSDRALPGVTVAGVDVGSLQQADVLERLNSELARPWSENAVVATHDGQRWSTPNGALGVRPAVGAATEAALSYGKTGSAGDRLTAWFDALRGEARVPLTLQAQGDGLDRWLTQVASSLDRVAVSGSLDVNATGLVVTEPIVGRQLDRAATAASILAAESLTDREIALSVRPVYPAVDESGFRDALAKARAVTTPLTVTVEDRRVDEDAQGLASLLQIARVAAKSGEVAVLPTGAIAPQVRYRYAVSVDESRVTAWVAALGVKLD